MKTVNTLLFIGSFLVINLNAISQNTGSIKIKGDNIYLDSLIDKNIAKNKINRTIAGYRIQLFSGNERINANNIKTKFLRLFPEQTAYLLYQQPYFKIRVGDFRSKLEAKLFYNKIKEEFSESIIIQDKINLPKL
ncbi:MAG: SPOR domain-containing protein [Bacteroidia bacterium]|nr:SPOR domain-containing protein [Bacteroidia bacterium]